MSKHKPRPNLRLRQLRKERGWSQGDLARALRTNQQNVSRLEAGVTQMNDRWLQKLSVALEVPPALLLDDALPEEEERLITAFARLDERERKTVLDLAEMLASRAATEM